jgi:hypothetical protein
MLTAIRGDVGKLMQLVGAQSTRRTFGKRENWPVGEDEDCEGKLTKTLSGLCHVQVAVWTPSNIKREEQRKVVVNPP